MAHDPAEAPRAAGLGGRLLTFAGDGEFSALSGAVTALVCAPSTDHPGYGDVLEWTVTTTAEVIALKLGPIVNGGIADYHIKIRTPDGRIVEIGELPAPECHLWIAIVDALTGDTHRARHHLAPVVHGTDREGQIRALLEALAWLDRLLDIPAFPEPDTATG
ncbi:hypothetical protein G352_01202 [Rhodococcus ruber BKS 20-38]|uniref:Uncharacterized protein n=1 Tax=Rhodococcus ruber BKS 20-38 TaxID=1278076 RepID=M3A2N6_9NOCA|nr:hypothetical protein [Rhodococcus ruber]EME67213.1 hypothetical protein G352_01202 [Rhodococcus ruber BKS 20-38]